MGYDHKDNSGAIFKNDKGDNPSRPDYRGDCKINGEVLEIAAWIKDGKNGKFMSLSFKPKHGERESAPSPKPAAAADLDDSIPF